MGSHLDDEELSMSLSGPPPYPPGHRARYAPDPSLVTPARNSSRHGDATKTGKIEQRIGQYSVKKTLGEGSFGKVKLAVHRVSGQEVALKIISRKKLISRDMAGRVEREIQYLQLLRHPHIIKLYTVITTPNEIIMVLEYAGEELFDYIVKHGKMSENKARRFFQQIVCAVEYCHRHKIVHRDLKPENLLLDSDLNVKIADFGLSNIMTDGNFLKTSCGSPNYAAPEVISGKLYAGPEVDVWSCGIILYVLLIGRLPFDDDFIPALFRKINSGTYHIPSYLSSGARNLIQKMLKVNPVQRITIQEIRQDEWFNENLEDYLKPSADEFIDTGVDPNKAIDPRQLAPGKPAAEQEQIHQNVIGKLGKTMGYARDDVAEALQKDEPNAIKDAYLIVRENQIMQNNRKSIDLTCRPELTTEATLIAANNTQPFLATSPPAWDISMATTAFPFSSPLTLAQDRSAPSVKPERESVPAVVQPSSVTSVEHKDAYVSKVSILASSLPFYHNQYMEQHRKDLEQRRTQEEANRRLKAQGAELVDPDAPPPQPDDLTTIKSPEEQAAISRHLKPHSRSTLQLQQITAQPHEQPAEESKTEPKKGRTRWQFGIRSRNVPHEAMHCVYKALKAQGAQWEVPPPETPSSHRPYTYPVTVKGATSVNETIHTRSNSPELSRHTTQQTQPDSTQFYGSGPPSTDGAGGNSRVASWKRDDEGAETEDEDVDPAVAPTGYIPKDPWCIRVRWRKDGMIPPTIAASGSAHSSRADLPSAAASAGGAQDLSRPGSMLAASSTTGLSSAAASTTSMHGGGGGGGGSSSDIALSLPATDRSSAAASAADGSCYVYMDVQLYTLEAPGDGGRTGTYLVDFKCAGYEAMVEKVAADTTRYLTGQGHRCIDKNVTSPQPFLDLTNRLVIHLASGGA